MDRDRHQWIMSGHAFWELRKCTVRLWSDRMAVTSHCMIYDYRHLGFLCCWWTTQEKKKKKINPRTKLDNDEHLAVGNYITSLMFRKSNADKPDILTILHLESDLHQNWPNILILLLTWSNIAHKETVGQEELLLSNCWNCFLCCAVWKFFQHSQVLMWKF